VAALTLRGVYKRYGSVTALAGVDLDVPAGAFFGLLGPNGAGKSSLIGAVAGLVKDVEGEVLVFGARAGSRPAKAAVGLAEQDNNLNREWSVWNTLVLHGRLFGMTRRAARDRAEEVIETFGLEHRRAARTAKLSGGERRRLVLARAVMHRPRLVILDEPTASVDVKRRLALWELMRAIHDQGATVLLITHDPEEAALCDHLAFIEHGQIGIQGAVSDLYARYHVNTPHALYALIIKEEK
jgi:ABC-2 type transport system ATP-binding protein